MLWFVLNYGFWLSIVVTDTVSLPNDISMQENRRLLYPRLP